MEIEHCCQQYVLINSQQHFGKVKFDEDLYIVQILNYLKYMQKNIPHQLNEIVKTKDFVYDNKKANRGILYLLPKMLKLKTISPESISVLKSRGIKSSMSDPIQCVQKVFDHIFNHLLYHIEEQFHKDFQCLSPSCTSVNEAKT